MALVAGVALTGCSGGGAKKAGGSGPAKSTNTVEIKGFKFVPSVITVKVGTVVTWTNADDVQHSATATDKTFDSKLFGKGKSYSFTFTKTGKFDYFCSAHQYMTGTVMVS
ncbi:MAG: cupredoxin family copper-binding protein [Pseudonocardiales bacterium]